MDTGATGLIEPSSTRTLFRGLGLTSGYRYLASAVRHLGPLQYGCSVSPVVEYSFLPSFLYDIKKPWAYPLCSALQFPQMFHLWVIDEALAAEIVAAVECSLSRRKFTAEWPGAIDNGSACPFRHFPLVSSGPTYCMIDDMKSSISIALMYGA